METGLAAAHPESRPTPAAAPTARPPCASTSRRWASTPSCAAHGAATPGSSTPPTTATTASTSPTWAATWPRRRARSRRARLPRGRGRGAAAARTPARARVTLVKLRTYRLALVTDPSYATYFGTANVLAEKVTLVNRVNEVYNDDLAIRLVLINDTDKLNLDTAAKATGANGPCGGGACFTAASWPAAAAQPERHPDRARPAHRRRQLRHRPPRRWASRRRCGLAGSSAATTRRTAAPASRRPRATSTRIDYVAHEMGHQFGGNHTFNGTQSNCSGGNRNAGSLGRARLRHVGDGLRRHLPAGQPAAALRPVLQPAEPERDHRVHRRRPRPTSTRCRPSRSTTSTAPTPSP